MHHSISKPVSTIGTFLLFQCILLAVYSPAIQIDFLWRLDYGTFVLGDERKYDLMHTALRDGRILKGYLWSIMDYYFNSTGSTIMLRLSSITVLSLLAYVTYKIFRISRLRTEHAFLISILICLLPALQIMVIGIILSPYIYSALLSSLSALILFNSTSDHESKKRTKVALEVLSAIILFVAALCLFQPSAMMYFAAGVIFFILGNNVDFSKKGPLLHLIKYFITGFASIGIYNIVGMKIIPFITNVPLARGAFLPMESIHHKLKWFTIIPFKVSLNLWNIYPTNIIAYFVGGIIICGITISILRETKDKKTPLSISIQKYFILVCLVMLSFFPNLVIEKNVSAYRTLLSLSAILAMLFCFGIINIVDFLKSPLNFSSETRNRVITISLIVLVIITAFLSHNNVNKSALQHSSELQYVKNTINDYGITNLLKNNKIYVRRPMYNENISKTHNEFNILGQLDTLGASGPVEEIIKIALHASGIKQNIQITHGAAEDPVPTNKNVLIIDMTKYDFPEKSN